MMLTLAACAEVDAPVPPASSPNHRSTAFEQRANVVAQAWRAGPGPKTWRTGFVPLQDQTVLPADPKFSTETKQAFLAGWYRARTELSPALPDGGVIRFPDGTLSVPLITAADAFEQIDQGDPPPCSDPPTAPPTKAAAVPSGPHSAVSSAPRTACQPLTVTAAKLGSVAMLTSRGRAEVPAWLFTVEELAAPVARVAVESSSVAPLPTVPVPEPSTAGVLAVAQDLLAVEGAKVTYRLGTGACDHDIVPLVRQYDDLVVVAGGATRSPGVCTDQLISTPVTVTLDAPLEARPVLDATTGVPLLLTRG